jgi:hypothetical protein
MTTTFSNPAGSAQETAAAYSQGLLELLGDRDPLDVMRELPGAIDDAVAGLSDAQLRTPEQPGKWSVVEVIQHLADSELVFGYRVRMTLAHETPPIQGYDQDAWATSLRYRDVSLEDSLNQLGVLRDRDIALLRTLSPSEWERIGVHFERGPESVRRMAELIAGHDILHRRQIDRIKRAIGVG